MLVLPAGGATLSWFLLMTLWMPLLNYAQSYNVLVQRTIAQTGESGCAESLGLGQGQIAAFAFYGHLRLIPAQRTPQCPWLLAEPNQNASPSDSVDQNIWQLQGSIRHPVDGEENVLLFKRR